MNNSRASNIELLRIIAISFVVIWHISIHAQKGEVATHNAILSITNTGVNIFVLISGYFGIKLKWKSLLNFLNILIFYSIVTLLANKFIFGNAITIEYIINTCFPISRHTWWFASCYFMLMAISPAINTLLNKSNEKTYLLFLGAMFYISCISGFVFQNPANIDGYTFINFIFIYSIGHAIKKYNIAEKTGYPKLLLAYALATSVIFMGATLGIGRVRNYNNPVLIVAAFSLFCIIAKTKLQNKTINNIATYAFPVYLIQDSSLGFSIYNLLYNYGKTLNFTGVKYIAIITLYLAALLAGTFILEKIRLSVFSKTIESYSKKLTERFNIFTE